MRLALLLLLPTLALMTACSTLPDRPEGGGFVAREVTVDGHRHPYQVFVPARGAVRGKPPVVLFLHGSGERGSDNQRQLGVGLGPHLRAHADSFPAIVVLPQAPEDAEWSQVADVVFAQLDAATREFGGDPRRTVLTGLSMGGYGTWDYALRQPRRFAALVPVCGGLVHPRRPSMGVTGLQDVAEPENVVARSLRGTPVWMFHGALDDLVPADNSRRLEAAFQRAGAVDVRYTEYPDANHNSWDRAYAEPGLWNWVFSQRR